MKAPEPLAALESSGPQDVALENVSFAYDGGAPILRGLTLTAHPGDIIGVTGPVACGKSKLGAYSSASSATAAPSASSDGNCPV